MMNKKAMIEAITQYVSSQQHERENLIEKMTDIAKDLKIEGNNKKQIKALLYSQRENSIYWIARTLAHNKYIANSSYRSCIYEVLERIGL